MEREPCYTAEIVQQFRSVNRANNDVRSRLHR